MKKVVQKVDDLIRKNPIVFVAILFFVVGIITSTIYMTYAYFTADVRGEGNQITISTSNGSLTFTDQNEINETGIIPGTTITKTFFVTNTSNGTLTYKLNWKFLKNNFYNREYLKYTITSTGGGSLTSRPIPDSEDHINILTTTIPGNTTQNYTMTITYEDHGQGNEDINRNIVGKLEITDVEANSITAQSTTGTYNTSLAGKTSIYGITLGSLAREIYPIGSIYTSTESTNPSELFLGTSWEVYGTGRTLVGVGTGTDADGKSKAFSVNEVGGTADEVLAYHNHGLNGDGARALASGAHTHTVSGSTTTDGLHTHTVPAGSIQTTVTNSASQRSITTAMPDQLTEEFEEGVYYGEHTHNFSATGQTSSTATTGTGTAHTHTYQIPSLTTKAGGGTHTHTTEPEGGSSSTTLADAILNANTPVSSPTTTPGSDIATTDEGLIIGPVDDYGDNTFYFRGRIQDNYVSFAGFTWRVIRINGDGTVRMVLDDSSGVTSQWFNNYNTDDYNTAISRLTYSNSPMKTAVENWYNTNIGNNNTYNNLIATGKYCNDLSHTGTTAPISFGGSNPSFACPNSSDVYNLKVGYMTADEVEYAGGKEWTRNTYYYLYKGYSWWTMTPFAWYDDGALMAFKVSDTDSGMVYAGLNFDVSVRPVINLKTNVAISGGDGSSASPYTLKNRLIVNLKTSTEASHTHTLAANTLKSKNTSNSGASAGESGHTHLLGANFSGGSGGSYEAYVMANKRANHAYNTGGGTSHSHTIAAGNLKVYSKAAVTLPQSTTKHTHNITIPALDIETSGAHTHSTEAVSGLTTGGVGTTFSDKIKEDNPPSSNPSTEPGREISTTDEGLITGPNDDYGNPTYYFRGNIQDNYVSFAGKTWRIVRINGDGSVRMILNTNATNARFNTQIDSTSGDAYHTDNLATVISWSTYSNSPVKTNVDSWYSSNIGNNNTYDNMVATGKYCNDLSYTQSGDFINFGAVNRLDNVSTATPQFICPNSSDIYNLKVGLITADEVTFAGATDYTSNSSNTSFFLYRNSDYWTMSPHSWNRDGNNGVRGFRFSKELDYHYINQSFAISPVINIKSNVYVTGGDGTENNPYTLSSSPTSPEGTHSHNIPSLTIASVTGGTVDNNDSGSHVHTVNIPAIRSRNNTSVSISNVGSSHNHDIEGTTSSNGGHTHTLVGNTTVVGTNATNANLQPYITVYMWKRTA